MIKIKRIFLVLGILLALTGCDKEEEDIPSYIYITKFDFFTDYTTEGPESSNIEDAVVIVNNKEYGTFTLPAMVPVNVSGSAEIVLLPGIRENGGSQNRKVYPLYEAYKTTLNLVEKNIDTLNPVTTYKDNVKFVWMEDFESNAKTMVPSINHKSTDSIQVIDSSNNEAFKAIYSSKTAYINMGTTDTSNEEIFEFRTFKDFAVPNGDNDVFLEFDFKTNTNVQFGIYADKTIIYEQIGIFVVSPTEGEWKKMYLNLNSETGVLNDGDKIQVFFGIYNSGVDPSFVPELYLDNLKLVHLN